jgi:hypothetical protein
VAVMTVWEFIFAQFSTLIGAEARAHLIFLSRFAPKWMRTSKTDHSCLFPGLARCALFSQTLRCMKKSRFLGFFLPRVTESSMD